MSAQPLRSIDLVLPVLNEEASLPAALRSITIARDHLHERHPTVEVCLIICDGNSTDSTVSIAQNAGAQVVASTKTGRGNQLADGVELGSGELVLMLHADSQLAPNALTRLTDALCLDREVSWGVIGHQYDKDSRLMRWVHITNRLRFACLGIAFGDQGIFVRRKTLEAAGGIPRLVLMEDIELSHRLRKHGSRLSLGTSQTISARHFEGRGWRYMLKVFCLTTWWLIARSFGSDPEVLATRFYQRYYGKLPA